MNVACTQCSARYAVSDERVSGKKVRIKCKRCGSAFVVDGTAPPGTGLSLRAPPKGNAQQQQPQTTPQPAEVSGPSDLWMVAVREDDTREMTDEQLIDAFSAKTIDQYTFVWREGMADWQTPFEIPALAQALEARGFKLAAAALPPQGLGSGSVVWHEPGRGGSTPNPLPSYDGDSDQEVTRAISRVDLEAQENAPKDSAQGLAPLTTGGNFFKPAERAKISERPSGADLFAQSEEATKAEGVSEPPPPAAADASLTGVRHESSVLFSLNALVSREEGRRPASEEKQQERVNEEALFAGMAAESSDPIATLSAGVDAMLTAAPDSQPPGSLAALPVSRPPPAPAHRTHPGWWIALGTVLVLAGGVFALISLDLVHVEIKPAGSAEAELPLPVPREEPPPASEPLPEPVDTAAALPTASAVPTVAAAATVSAPAPTTTAPTTTPTAAPTSPSPQPTAVATATLPAAPAPAPAATAKPTATATPPAPTAPVAAAPAAPAPAPAAPDPAAASGAPPFSTDAAKAALNSAAANASGSCKVPGTPAGTSKVSVTFVPSGKATQALVSGDFAGSPAGSCIARVFRGAQIPAFSGASVTVTKSVTLH